MGRNAERSSQKSCGLTLVILLLLSAATLQAQEPEGNIAGQIRLLDGSFPNGRLQVTLEGHGAVVGVTYCDSEGRFSFNDLLPNAYSVLIKGYGYQGLRESISVNHAHTHTYIVHI